MINSWIFIENEIFDSYEVYENCVDQVIALKYAGISSEVLHEEKVLDLCQDPRLHTYGKLHTHEFIIYAF